MFISLNAWIKVNARNTVNAAKPACQEEDSIRDLNAAAVVVP